MSSFFSMGGWRKALFFLAIAFAVSCGSRSAMPTGPLITFTSSKQVHLQRETVSAKVEPALAKNEFLQIWVQADDHQWYPCGAAKQDAALGGWNAVCQFGSDQHPAPDGAQFVLGAFYSAKKVNVEYLPDAVWDLLKAKVTQPVVFNRTR